MNCKSLGGQQGPKADSPGTPAQPSPRGSRAGELPAPWGPLQSLPSEHRAISPASRWPLLHVSRPCLLCTNAKVRSPGPRHCSPKLTAGRERIVTRAGRNAVSVVKDELTAWGTQDPPEQGWTPSSLSRPFQAALCRVRASQPGSSLWNQDWYGEAGVLSGAQDDSHRSGPVDRRRALGNPALPKG